MSANFAYILQGFSKLTSYNRFNTSFTIFYALVFQVWVEKL